MSIERNSEVVEQLKKKLAKEGYRKPVVETADPAVRVSARYVGSITEAKVKSEMDKSKE